MYETLLDVIKSVSALRDKGVTFIDNDDSERFTSYGRIYDKSSNILYNLQELGLKPQNELIFQIEDNETFILVFWACVMGGIIPVPIHISNSEEDKNRVLNVWKTLKNPYLIADTTIQQLLHEFLTNKEGLTDIDDKFIPLEKIQLKKGVGVLDEDVKGESSALVQFSSGSTSTPKGIVLTHENVLSNLLVTLKSLKPESHDSALSWMPLTHNMGLMFFIAALMAGVNQYMMPTSLFVMQPLLWLDKTSHHQITIISSPNFGYKHLLDNFNPEVAENWDLSSVRIILNGAEPISSELCHIFLNTMEPYGLGKATMFPAYGLAEAGIAVTLPTVGETVKTSHLDRASISVGQEVKEASNPEQAAKFVDVGYPLENCKLRICDDQDQEVAENIVGNIQLKGPNITRQVYADKEQTQDMFTEDGWLETGDLGFMHDGSLTVTGRAKDIIFINGQNFYPSDIEKIALYIIKTFFNPEIFGNVAACSIPNDETQKEEIILFITYREDPATFIPIATMLKDRISKTIGYPIKHIIPIENLPITSSGKIQRYKLIQQYQQDQFQQITNQFKKKNNETILPQNEVEKKLISIWQETLRIKEIKTHDNFFQLGGHSLKATNLSTKIQKEFNINFPIRTVYETPTITQMAEHIKNAQKYTHTPIKPAKKREYYPMSSAQKRLYILDQFEGAGIAFNLPGVMIIDGDLDRLRFEESFHELIRRHEILRTSFTMKDIEPIQIIHDNIDFNLTYLESNEEEIDSIINGFIKPFDLSQAPLLRVFLVKVDKHRHFLLFDMHHIISDGTSINILMQEIINFYEGKSLPDLRIQYKDYSLWQKKQHQQEKLEKQEKYWLETFNDEIPMLNIPLDYPRPMVQSFEGDRIFFEIGRDLTEKLNKLVQDEGATLYMVLLASLNILFSKYTGQNDIVIGSVVADRPHADLENMIGMFANTLAIRNYPQGEKVFKEFLEDVKENALKAYENQDYQFDELVENLNLKRDFSRNPIFDVMFVLQNMDITDMEMKGLKFTHYENPFLVSKVDILLNAMERGNKIIFDLEYCTKLFKKETIEKLAGHYVNILEEIVKNPHLKLKEISIITEEDENILLYDFNNTKSEYSRYKTIHELFEEQVERTPEDVAIIYENMQLTYQELNKKANQLAHILRDKKIKPDSIVGIMVERSPEMIIGILGVLKAGGAYLPIDPSYPEERIMYILKDSAAGILLTQQKYESRVSFNGEILDLKNPDLYVGSGLNLEKVNTSHDLAYVIYTSGSTGKPKGVMIEHYSVINKLEWMLKEYPITADDVLIQKTPYTFDASVYELFIWSFTGAKLCLLKPDGEKDPEEIINAIEKHQVTTIEFVPSMLSVFLGHIEENQCLNRLKSLKHVTTGGEALTKDHVKRFNRTLKSHNTNLINTYGPTETTIDVSYYYCNAKTPETIPIGKPINNIQLYIMDKYQKLQPIGIPGEICISGDGLSRGYLNKPNLTYKSFVNNPFKKGKRLYRTGDLARWLPDGNIEFLGRIDHQVKIRGNRIELGEIESRLLEHPLITETVVVTKEDPENCKYLCTYFLGREKLSVPRLREYLSKYLPDYMIPHYFVQLEKMPLNRNGKVDRESLPEVDGNIHIGVEYVAPRNEIEEKLVKIWQDILKVDKIGVKDDFFSLGGDSIKAIQVSSRLNSYGLKLELTEMLKNPVIEELSNHVTPTTCQIDQGLVNVHSDIVLLNYKKDKNIFAFPGMGTFALMYMKMASGFENHSFYAFNFIEDDNRIKEYADIICSIQDTGPYILLGYSAGGNLAFEVVKELNNRGLEVSELILLDSPYKKVKINLTEEAIKFYTDELKNYKQYKDLINDTYIKNNTSKKIKSYAEFYINFINSGITSANIHLINAEASNNRNDWLKIGKNGWKESTSKSFAMHNGYGTHHNMLIDDFLVQNTKIIRKIIND